jgi:hypothetical protein
MAYVSQERKAKLAPAIKAVCTKYGVKATLAVRHHSTLVINIKQGSIDFIKNYSAATESNRSGRPDFTPELDIKYIDVNPYWFHEHFTGTAKNFLTELFAAAKGTEWYDRSDAQTDYFDTAYYIDVNIGSWNKPYALVK